MNDISFGSFAYMLLVSKSNKESSNNDSEETFFLPKPKYQKSFYSFLPLPYFLCEFFSTNISHSFALFFVIVFPTGFPPGHMILHPDLSTTPVQTADYGKARVQWMCLQRSL